MTIYHWDHPLELEKRYGGWFSKDDIVRDFVNFANIVFEALGDRVKNWCTINEVSCTIVSRLTLASYQYYVDGAFVQKGPVWH